MRRLFICGMLAILLASASAETPGHSPKSWQEYAYNNDNYNANFNKYVDKEVLRLDTTRNAQFADVLKTQGAQDAEIKSIQETTLLGRGLVLLLLAAIPIWMKWQEGIKTKNAIIVAANQKKIDDDLAGRIARIVSLEVNQARDDERFKVIGKMNGLFADMSGLFTDSLSDQLHHDDAWRAHADKLLDTIKSRVELSHTETAELDVLMKARSTDDTVSTQEQSAAKNLPKMMQLVKEMRVITQQVEKDTQSANTPPVA